MKVLFAVSNDKMSETIIKQYQKEYKQVISYKNVYYFNAILKELQKDKTYDRIVISEYLEQYTNNNDFEKNDNFIFSILDNISDEAYNQSGEDVPIILICNERRNKSESIFVKLFGIGIYNAIIGDDRSVNEVCRLLYRPRAKKEAKIYYKIDSEDVSYEKDDENSVNEIEIQNILSHYKRLGNNEDKYVDSFESIASQYNNQQLKVICKCLPLNVRAVLEEKSVRYQQVNSFNNKIADHARISKDEKKKGPSEIFLKSVNNNEISEPVVIPSSIDTTKIKKLENNEFNSEKNNNMTFEGIDSTRNNENVEAQSLDELFSDLSLDSNENVEENQSKDELQNNIDTKVVEQSHLNEDVPIKRGRGRPKKIKTETEIQMPKRGRGRPRKNVETIIEDENTFLPGIENKDEEVMLPGINDSKQTGNNSIESEINNGLQNYTNENNIMISDLQNENTVNQKDEENKYSNVLNNLKSQNEFEFHNNLYEEVKEYPELNIQDLLVNNQKIVSFLGTSKNGTSFLINNVAELLSSNGVNVAILDLTKNRNAYFIYTKNEDVLREKSNYTLDNLIQGKADGIQVHRNLTVYTSPIENDDKLQDVEPIIETLLKNHTLILLDCDFNTPMKYFKYSQEIYLVQSMDILTIQPLTSFVRQLKDKNMFDETKARVILNKFIRTKEINESILIGGISIYNDPSMTVRKELFNRKTVQYITIPFELKTYLRYLDGLVVCDVSLNGYSKEFMQSLKQLSNMVYSINTKNAKYMPPSVKKNSNYTSNINNTLDEMRRNY